MSIEMQVLPPNGGQNYLGGNDQFISPVFESGPAEQYHSDEDEDIPVPTIMTNPATNNINLNNNYNPNNNNTNYRPSHGLRDEDYDHQQQQQSNVGDDEDIEIRDDWAGSHEFNADSNDPAEHFKQRVVFIKAVLGELLCTTIFLFVIMANGVNFARLQQEDGAFYSNPVVGGLCTAFVAVAVIYAFADVSGANFNPCVTFAALVTRKTTPVKFAFYVAAQLLASIFATFLVWLCFPDTNGTTFGAIQLCVVRLGEGVQVGEALLIEFLMAFMLVYIIFAVAFDTIQPEVQVVNASGQDTTRRKKLTIYSTSGKTKAGFAPIAIGFTHGFLAFIAGSVSGGAFNPARAFGPALLGWSWEHHWIYWFAEFAGGALAGYTQLFFSARGRLCCSVLQAPAEKNK